MYMSYVFHHLSNKLRTQLNKKASFLRLSCTLWHAMAIKAWGTTNHYICAKLFFFSRTNYIVTYRSVGMKINQYNMNTFAHLLNILIPQHSNAKNRHICINTHTKLYLCIHTYSYLIYKNISYKNTHITSFFLVFSKLVVLLPTLLPSGKRCSFVPCGTYIFCFCVEALSEWKNIHIWLNCIWWPL